MTLPTFRQQIGDPTTWLDAYICTLESAAMGLDFTTSGSVSVWGGQLVPYCGKSAKDIAGASGHPGTTLQNAKLAWAHWGQLLEIRDDAWAALRAELQDGNAILLQGDYGALPAGDRCSSTFQDNHCVIVMPEVSVDGVSVLTGDPICSGFRWRSLRGLRAYAEQLAQNIRGDRTRLFYAVANKPTLPDTGTEEPMPLIVTKLRARAGVATVKAGPKRAAVQVADREYFWFNPGDQKRYVAEGVLVPPLDNNPGDRSSVFLVGDEAAVFLKMDVDPKDDTTGDTTMYNAGVTAASAKALEAKRP
jgi:hypothetical protein